MCDAPVGGNQTLCPDCWKAIQFVEAPWCACCGAPFPIPVAEGSLCGACIEKPPRFTAARSAMIYNDGSKKLILHFKHDRLHPAPALAQWMLRVGGDLVAQADCIVPVPLHRWRLFKRRYNQSAVIAHALAKLTGKPVVVDALIRTRATPSQGRMNRQQRRANVHGACAVALKRKALIKERNIVLIDDVFTTGATVDECCRALLAAGAQKVFVITLARTRMAD